MKKYAPWVILFLIAALAWNLFFSWDGMIVHVDGEEFGGPLGALLGMLFAGGGIMVATLVMLVVGVVLAVVFAGVGIVVIGAVGFAFLAVGLAVAPLLLPLLLPIALVWYFVNRSRKNRMAREQAV